MELKLKYNIDETVFFMWKNRVVEDQVRGFSATAPATNPNAVDGVLIVYQCLAEHEGKMEDFYEGQLYKSKQALLASL